MNLIPVCRKFSGVYGESFQHVNCYPAGMSKMNLERFKKLAGANIKAARTKAGFSTANAFAVEVKLDPGTIRNIERGAHGLTLKTLLTISNFLDLEPWELLHPAPETMKALGAFVRAQLEKDQPKEKEYADPQSTTRSSGVRKPVGVGG